MCDGSNTAIQSRKSLADAKYGTHSVDLPQGSISHVLEASIAYPKNRLLELRAAPV